MIYVYLADGFEETEAGGGEEPEVPTTPPKVRLSSNRSSRSNRTENLRFFVFSD